MTKELIKELQDKARSIERTVFNLIVEKTIDNPLIVFKEDDLIDDEELLYNLPYGYSIGKHFDNYIEGTIQIVCGDEVTLYLRGEEQGELIKQSLYEVPYESLVELLTYIIEREEK